MRLLVTGASGFIGRALLERFQRRGGHELRAAVRRPEPRPVPAVEYTTVAGLDADTDWSAAVAGCETVVHAAARVHVMKDTDANPLAAFRRVNVDGTLSLARQAVAHGVRRFVFISSIKVNGEETAPERPFRADDEPAPSDAYGISKLEAEIGLRELLGNAGVDWVIVRPPLVYGPHVKGNFLKLMEWMRRRVPLPFADVRNRRSLAALDNLISLLDSCSTHPGAANQLFLAGDDEDLSTPELLRRIGSVIGKPARLFHVPPGMLMAAASMVGRRDLARRLIGTLHVDVAKARGLLGWAPEVTVDEGLEKTVKAFLESKGQ